MNRPTDVVTTTMQGPVTDITGASQFSCAVSSEKAYCWGVGGHAPTARGHLGTGTTSSYSTPQPVVTSAMSGPVTQISASGSTHTCAVADKKAYCWGGATSGRLGIGETSLEYIAAPQGVNTSTMDGDVSYIDTSHSHTCAIADKKAYCWGQGAHGRLGNGSTAIQYTPVEVSQPSQL